MGTTNTDIKYNIVQDDGEDSSVTVFLPNGSQLVATRDHKNWLAIVDALKNGSATARNVRGMFDLSDALSKRFTTITERVTIANGHVYFDHDVMEGALVDAILRFYEAEQAEAMAVPSTLTRSTAAVPRQFSKGRYTWQPLVLFLEKVMQNPQEHSRKQLFRWLEKHHYAIADDGDFIAYKGVQDDGKSKHSGGAFVNGEWVDGRIPNIPGTVVEMARSKVAFSPDEACSTGLHVGNWEYATGFASRWLRIKVNPRDVVSVPTGCNDAKVRVCRYYVLDVVKVEDRDLLYAGAYKTLKLPVPAAKPKVKPDPKECSASIAPASKSSGKKAAPKKAAPKKAAKPAAKPEPAEPEWPAAYEDFRKADFTRLASQQPGGFKECVWLAKEWDVKVPSPRSKVQYVDALNKEAQARTRRWKQENK